MDSNVGPGVVDLPCQVLGQKAQFLAGGSEKPDGGRLVLRFYLVPGWHA